MDQFFKSYIIQSKAKLAGNKRQTVYEKWQTNYIPESEFLENGKPFKENGKPIALTIYG